MTSHAEQDPGPTLVGPYRVLAPIGEGGMGVVHLAQAPDGRRVALKVLRPHIVGDREARERLAREVSSLKRISSPRIAEILDADPHGPVPYVVTRYVPGLSLYHHVAEEGPVGGQDLLHFADCLAEALLAVHSVGVLHRDVKPTNVLMEGRSPVLIDFGLARVAEDPRLTQTGFLLGTPGYLAPEILYGDEASTASDVHAWAATVAFAAIGRPPYGTGPAMAIMDRVRRGQHDLSAVDERLRPLLGDALAPEPLERPSLHELRASLTDLRHREHVAVVPPAGSAQELWTMPFAPAPLPETAVTEQLPQATSVTPATPPPSPAPSSPAAASTPAPVAPAVAPTTTPTRNPLQSPVQSPVQNPTPAPAQKPTAGAPPPWIVDPPRESSPAQQVLQLLGLGALTAATAAYAPYLGTALVGAVVLVARTVSVTRQRHRRRRALRGRARWYDVPATTLASPGYLAIALLGAVALVVTGVLVALALGSLGYLLQQPLAPTMTVAGVGFAVALWWGPGSGRLRETVRPVLARTARSEYGGWFVVAMSVLGAAVLFGLLFSTGANWAPEAAAPWRR